GVSGEAYAQEQFTLEQGKARDFLEYVADTAVPLYEEHGWALAGAWETAMRNETECFLLWAIPTWERWASFEQAERADTPLRRWRRDSYERTTGCHRFLVVDAPLCPFRTGRQPRRGGGPRTPSRRSAEVVGGPASRPIECGDDGEPLGVPATELGGGARNQARPAVEAGLGEVAGPAAHLVGRRRHAGQRGRAECLGGRHLRAGRPPGVECGERLLDRAERRQVVDRH